MSDKERLQEIKRKAITFNQELREIDLEEHIDWIIEQAERVEELEKDLNEWRNEALRWLKLFEEYQERYLETKELNKRLREALEFYAGGNHYSDRLYDYKIVLLDDGEIARKALEGTE